MRPSPAVSFRAAVVVSTVLPLARSCHRQRQGSIRRAGRLRARYRRAACMKPMIENDYEECSVSRSRGREEEMKDRLSGQGVEGLGWESRPATDTAATGAFAFPARGANCCRRPRSQAFWTEAVQKQEGACSTTQESVGTSRKAGRRRRDKGVPGTRWAVPAGQASLAPD